MAGRLTRFLNLERARKPDLTPPHGVVTRARFSGEEPPAPDFAAQRAAQLESGVELDAHPLTEQPFLRCPVCEADNSKYAVRCINCAAHLDTDQVRDWNARLWAERQKAAAAEPPPTPPLLPSEQRALGEALAQEVAQRERARLSWTPGDTTPLGLRLLQLIPDPNARFAAAMGMVATFLGAGAVALAAHGHSGLRAGGTVVALALFALFMPNTRRRRWWDNW
jgi:hypothetical protein